MGNTVAVLMRKAPYGSVYTAEGFRTLMGVAVFEMDISVVFLDDGVYALKRGQNPEKLGMKSLGDGFPMLREFGVTKFYVHDASMTERGMTPGDITVEAEVVTGSQVAQILAGAGKVLSF